MEDDSRMDDDYEAWDEGFWCDADEADRLLPPPTGHHGHGALRPTMGFPGGAGPSGSASGSRDAEAIVIDDSD